MLCAAQAPWPACSAQDRIVAPNFKDTSSIYFSEHTSTITGNTHLPTALPPNHCKPFAAQKLKIAGLKCIKITCCQWDCFFMLAHLSSLPAPPFTCLNQVINSSDALSLSATRGRKEMKIEIAFCNTRCKTSDPFDQVFFCEFLD